jgi:hypothetical protein
MVLSGRCLIFANGMAFWRCRTNIFSEDTFWDQHPAVEPSPGIMAEVWGTDFLGRTTDGDPLADYVSFLQRYRARNLSSFDQLLSGFRGLLNRITDNMHHTHPLMGLPRGHFDMGLIWYHRPDMNAVGGLQPVRTRFPSWAWAGWYVIWSLSNLLVYRIEKGLTSSTTQQGQRRHHSLGAPREPARPALMGPVPRHDRRPAVLVPARQVNADYPDELLPVHIGDAHVPPAPQFPTEVNRFFLQFEALTMIAPADFGVGPVNGVGEIRTDDGTDRTAGMVYADDLLGRYTNFTFALICRAPMGDVNFDCGIWDAEENPARTGDTGDSFVSKPSVSAKGKDIWWVLMLDWYGRGFYQRAGLGFIRTDRLGWFSWSKEMIAIG